MLDKFYYYFDKSGVYTEQKISTNNQPDNSTDIKPTAYDKNTEKLKFLGQICVYKRTQQCIKGDGRQGVNYKLAG